MQSKIDVPVKLPKLHKVGMWMGSTAIALILYAPLALLLEVFRHNNPKALPLMAGNGAFIFISLCSGMSLLLISILLADVGKKSTASFSKGKEVKEFWLLLLMWLVWTFAICPLFFYLVLQAAEKEHIRDAVEKALLSSSWLAVLTVIVCFAALAHIRYYWKYHQNTLKMLLEGTK